jgi:hypothetical protein
MILQSSSQLAQVLTHLPLWFLRIEAVRVGTNCTKYVRVQWKGLKLSRKRRMKCLESESSQCTFQQ